MVCPPRKTNFLFSFCFQQTNRRLPFLFSVFSNKMRVAVFRQLRLRNSGNMENGDLETWSMETQAWRHGDIETSKEKRETEVQAISPYPFTFAHRANGSLSFGHLVTNKKKKVSIYKGTKPTKPTCPSMTYCQNSVCLCGKEE
jgi:hypothetical protein